MVELLILDDCPLKGLSKWSVPDLGMLFNLHCTMLLIFLFISLFFLLATIGENEQTESSCRRYTAVL